MKKGFTLIELLAVIVILAIIALIATPIVLSIINDVKISSAKSSMDNIEKALELYYFTNKIDNEITFSCEDGVCKTQNGDKLNVSGKLPSKGVITISKSGKITYDTVILDNYMCDKINNEFICSLASKNIVSSDGETIILDNPNSATLNNYKIYGDSIQAGIPTPNNPIEIESVGNKVKNLCSNKDIYFDTYNNYYIEEGTVTTTGPTLMGFIVKVEPNTEYTVSYNVIASTGGQNQRVREYSDYPADWSKDFITQPVSNAIKTTGVASQSFTTSDTTKYIVFGFYTDTSGVSIKDFQVEKGSIATDYELYYELYGYKIPVKASGKNLFNPKYNFNGYNGKGITIKYIEDEDVYVLNGTATTTIEYAIRRINIPAVKGSYYSLSSKYVSGKVTRTNEKDYALAYFGGADALESSLNNWQTVGFYEYDNKKENVQNYYNYINGFWFYITKGVSFDNYKVKIQLEKNSVATDYKSHVESTTNIYLNEPLRKIDTYVDYIDFKNKKLIRNVGVLTLNGEETWEEKEGIYYLEEFIGVSSDKNLSISTHFIYNEENGFWIDNNNRINVKYDGIGSIEEFKEWLKNNSVTIYYPLKKSKIEEVEFPKLNLNEKYSYISVDTSLKPSKILLEYN